jgi:hypothetical protein
MSVGNNNQQGLSDNVPNRPPKQQLDLLGQVSDDAQFIDLTATNVGKEGVWEKAFGIDNLTLTNTILHVALDESTTMTCHMPPDVPSLCGIPHIDITALASLAVKEGTAVMHVSQPAHGHIDVHSPRLSRLFIGEENSDFTFKVEGHQNPQYDRVTVGFAIDNGTVVEGENKLAAMGYPKAAFEKTREAVEVLGPELNATVCFNDEGNIVGVRQSHSNQPCYSTQWAPAYITKMAPTTVSVDGTKVRPDAPFEVAYEALYIGEKYHDTIGFSLADLINVRKGKYKARVGATGNCPDEHVIHRDAGYTSVEQAQRKCDAIEDCLSYSYANLTTMDETVALFCSSITLFTKATPVKEHGVLDSRFVVGMRESLDELLMDKDLIQSYTHFTMRLKLDEILKNKFADHAALFGFEFSPTLVHEETAGDVPTVWLETAIEPTETGVDEMSTVLDEAFMGAIAIAAATETGIQIQDAKGLKLEEDTTVNDAISEAGAYLTANAQGTVDGEITSYINMVFNEAMEAIGDPTRRYVSPWFNEDCTSKVAADCVTKPTNGSSSTVDTDLVQQMVDGVASMDHVGAPAGLCEKQADTGKACADEVAHGGCQRKAWKTCAKSCCEAGFWTDLLPDAKRNAGDHNEDVHPDAEDAGNVKKEMTVPEVSYSKADLKTFVTTMASKALAEAKQEVDDMHVALAQIRHKAEQPLQRVAQAFAKRMPKLHSLSVDRIYMQCVYWPDDCDPSLIVKPNMKICFTEMGCLSSANSTVEGESPTIATMHLWIKREAQRLTLEKFESLLTYETATLSVPEGVEYVYQPTKIGGAADAVELKMLNGATHTKDIVIRYPSSVNEAALTAFENAPDEKASPVDTTDIMPEGLTAKHLEHQIMKDNNLPGLHLPNNTDAEANKKILDAGKNVDKLDDDLEKEVHQEMAARKEKVDEVMKDENATAAFKGSATDSTAADSLIKAL